MVFDSFDKCREWLADKYPNTQPIKYLECEVPVKPYWRGSFVKMYLSFNPPNEIITVEYMFYPDNGQEVVYIDIFDTTIKGGH